MRFLFILLLVYPPASMHEQKKYQCAYTETVSFPFADSAIQTIRSQLEENGLPAHSVEKFLADFKDKGATSGYLRIVNAGPDSTFIVTKMNEENENNATTRELNKLKSHKFNGVADMVLEKPIVNMGHFLDQVQSMMA